ncbi:hypothetical protein CN978_30010 [Priestia megaterium]|uniref:hypothetical protein n=1 Tax=Priestia megaterium TaxID=1404 RepID=UPI000BFB8227|nr:hypothetical protein [Priestia megaterium]PGN53939.1 hypothetical protein CN978_30010 [Priestia megaterium]
MAKYYVSNTGSDTNNGLTQSTSWATLSKVNSYSASFKSGDTIYFKCNDTFYGQLVLPAGKDITVTSYGQGSKPKISGYKNILGTSWVQHSSNVYKVDLTNTSMFTGNIYFTDTNVGFLNIDGVIKGGKKSTLASLSGQWDFYSDAQFLYVYTNSKPDTLATSIKAAVNIQLIPLQNNTRILNLDILGTGAHAVKGTVSSVLVSNCDIHEVGGSYLTGYGDGTVRYGNGVEIWAGSKDVLVENNNVYDCYDVAFTMQGPVTTLGWDNVIFRNNTEWNNTQSFEIWSDGTNANTGFSKCAFEQNICMNAGYGWGYDPNADSEKAVNLLMYQLQTPVLDISIKNNIFYNPRAGLYYGSKDYNYEIPPGYKSDNNSVFLSKGKKINAKKTYTVEQFDEFSTATSKEKKSTFFIADTTTSSSMSDILSLLMNYSGSNKAHIKVLQSSINRLNGKIDELKTSFLDIDTFAKSNGGLEQSHVNGFLKLNGGYTTNQSSTVTTAYAPLCKITLTNVNDKFDMVMHYMICADSVINRNSIGVLNLQVVPNTGMLPNTKIDMDVVELLEFNSSYSSQDFVAVVEKEDGISVVVSLYFNIGKKNYSRMAFQPNLIYTDSQASPSYTFFNRGTLLTTLPSGTQVQPTTENPYNKRPKTGIAAPTTVPYYIGQEFVDTTNKKVYKAVGTSSSADWVALN